MKTTDWLGNTVSIGMLVVLAIASWGLAEMLQRGLLDASQAANGPNTIVDRPRVIRTDVSGAPKYRLEANRMSFEQQADRNVLEQPVVTSLTAGKPKTVIQSDVAIGTDEQNQLELIGNVRVNRDAFGGQPQARIATNQMMLFMKEELAQTDEPVLLQHGSSTLQGVGMRFDQKTQRIDILSESRMIVPKEKK